MRPSIPLVLSLSTLAWTGCPSIPPHAKPSAPPGVAAPDPKPANDAQAASDAAAQTLRVRLRVGSEYNAQTIITLPVMTTATDTRIVEMPEYLYSNWGTETVTLHADMSAGSSAGTVTCEECELTLIPLSQA